MGKVISESVQQVLQERRHRLNSLFLQARATYPHFAGDTFLSHLRDTIVPILEQVQAHDGTRLLVTLETLYETSLKLVAQGVMGPKAKSRVAELAWRNLLGTYPALLCQEPALVATSIANALVQLVEVHPDKAVMWHEAMGSLASFAKTPQEWLKAGLVVAWRCGLPHYRESALTKAAELNAVIGSAALGLEKELNHDAYQKILSELAKQPWVKPLEWIAGAASKPELKVFGWVGGFVGFGGHFSIPPDALAQGERLLLRDDVNAWSVEADCFGVLLKRVDIDSLNSAKIDRFPMRLGNDGMVSSQHGEWKVKAAADAASYAASSTTLIVVPRNSHRVLVSGLRLP